MFILEGRKWSEKIHILLGDEIEYYAKDLLPNSLSNLKKTMFVEKEFFLFKYWRNVLVPNGNWIYHDKCEFNLKEK